MTTSRANVLALAAAVLAVDIATKAIVAGTMRLHQSITLIDDWLRLTYIRNTGVAFGMFPGQRASFIVLSLIGLGAVGYYLARHRPQGLREVLALGLFMGGAAGNLIDRVRDGQVIDFVEVGARGHSFPVFNVADMGVTCGVALLVAAAIFPRRHAAAPGAPAPDAPLPETHGDEQPIDRGAAGGVG